MCIKNVQRNFDMLLLDHRFFYRSFSPRWVLAILSHLQNAQRARNRGEARLSIAQPQAETDIVSETQIVWVMHIAHPRSFSVRRPYRWIFVPVFRIRTSFHADPDPGSQKCPHGSGSKEVNTKEE